MDQYRFCDILFAFTALIFLSPVFFFIAIFGIIFGTKPFFKQTRLGKNQRPFVLVKFRTMKKSAGSVATHLIEPNQITNVGQILRRTKIDELPQLWNVLKGDMSIVGPRPGLDNQIQLKKARVTHNVFAVRPGITGLAQINGIDMSKPDLVARTDAIMISEMSLMNYFRYIFFTLIGHGQGDRVKKF